jgi:hypothetical protein
MTDDLLARFLVEGMSSDEVQALLGPPALPADVAMSIPSPDDLVYQVGCGIDCYWLIIQFDAGGGMTNAEVWQD